MDRRLAMKNLGLALGYSVATPTLISLVQSCKRETGPVWTPQFFTPEEGLVVMILADLILPKTNTPSATEVGVHVFIDGLLNEVSSAEEQDFFKNCMGKFTDKALTDTGKNSVADLSVEDMEPLLAETLKRRTDEEEDEIEDLLEYFPSFNRDDSEDKDSSDGSIELTDELYRYAFATEFRRTVLKAYKTTEYIGEEILAYLPVPGEYIGCGDLDELTGGKAWSL